MTQYGHYGDSPSQDDDTKPHLSPLRLTMGIIMVAIYLAMAYADKLLFLKNGRSCCLCTPDKVDSALLKEVYAVNADIAEADGRRFAIIRKEFTL